METDYPTEEQLKEIEEWDCTSYEKKVALAEYVCNLWHFSDWATLKGKKVKTLRLATAGWSGNEDIVGALRRNFIWMGTWEMSAKGGLSIYKIRPY